MKCRESRDLREILQIVKEFREEMHKMRNEIAILTKQKIEEEKI